MTCNTGRWTRNYDAQNKVTLYLMTLRASYTSRISLKIILYPNNESGEVIFVRFVRHKVFPAYLS
ncbi:MAG: hypothetical protein CL607_01825 [Anaerolineaceae bacterium]|nr:hypothetical protein [Anaerolineaceae bacterium]